MSSCLMCNKVVNGISQSPDTGLIQFSDSLALQQLLLALMLLQGRLVGLSAVSCRSPAVVFSAGQAVGVQPPGPVSVLQWGSEMLGLWEFIIGCCGAQPGP